MTPCLSCADPHDLPIAVCAACREAGACTVCGEEHRAWRCPQIAAERQRQATEERATHKQMIAARAKAMREEYERMPVWMEAA